MYLIDFIRSRVSEAGESIPRDVVCVDATPISKWTEANGKLEYNLVKDFPSLRLPYEHLWVEHTTTAAEDDTTQCRIGVHLTESPSSEKGILNLRFEVFSKFADEDTLSILPPAYCVKVKEDGSIVRSIDMRPLLGVYVNPAMPKGFELPEDDTVLNRSLSQILVSMFSVSFMNCKNITIKVDRDISEEYARKRVRAGRPPLVRMHTLVVDGVRKLFQEVTGSDAFSHNSYHLCRGHFKDFTHGRGLFGRYTGRYWWQPQARGSKSVGEVVKDYKVKP